MAEPEQKLNVKQHGTPHRWKKGESGNRNGRPKRPEAEELRNALKAAKKKFGKSFLNDYVEKSYSDSARATALLRKILPDLVQTDEDVNIKAVTLVTFESLGLRKKLAKDV